MTSQTFTASGTVVVGTREITFSDLGQALVAGLVDGGGTATLDLLRIASATAELETADDADLTAVWERSATAITIASGEHSATVFGPNHPGSFRDDSAPYLWIHGSSSAVIALVTALGAGAHTFTITLDDGVADTTTTVTANAGADKSVASGGTVQLDGSATVQNGQGATTWAWSRISGSGGSLDDATAQEPTFTAPTLQAGAANRQIVYELVATNNGVASEAVEVTITVTAPALQRPGPVRSLAAASEDGEANPTWEAPNTGGAVAEILVDYLVDSVGSWTGLQTLAADATTARITGLTNGQAITIRVRAQNTAGTSIAAEVGVTPMAAPPTPTAPVLSGVAGDASAELTWPAVPNATDYQRRHKRSDAQSWGDWAAADADRSQRFGGLVNGVSYDFQVRAITATQEGPASNTVTLTPMAAAPPPPASRRAGVEVSRLDAGPIVDLFTVRLQGGGVERYTAGPHGSASAMYDGEEYRPLPIALEGADFRSSGAFSRPTLRVSLLDGTAVPIDWQGATIERVRTLGRYLDGAAEADPNRHWPKESWVVDRLSGRGREELSWQLSAPLDLQLAMIPRRQVLRDVCQWEYRRRVGGQWVNPEADDGCPYRGTRADGGPFWNAQDESVADATLDVCSRRLSGCKLRFGENGDLPFGGFAGVSQLRR